MKAEKPFFNNLFTSQHCTASQRATWWLQGRHLNKSTKLLMKYAIVNIVCRNKRQRNEEMEETKAVTRHGMFLQWWNTKNIFPPFDNVFHVYLRGLQKYAKNWNLIVAFWATCKIGQPIQPIWQQFFALPCSALKKLFWELNFLHIFAVPSSRHEKRCQMLEILFL